MLGGYTFPASLSQFQSTTMLQALQGGGGSGVTGAAKILLRAGTAAYLNADVEILYPYRRDTTGFGGVASLRSLITSALNSGDRATMLALAPSSTRRTTSAARSASAWWRERASCGAFPPPRIAIPGAPDLAVEALPVCCGPGAVACHAPGP